MNILNKIIGIFFPNTCPCCGTIISEEDTLCDYCHEIIERYDNNEQCSITSEHKYHFENCLSAFKNVGIGKKAMYDFKFNRKTKNADLFSTQMALLVKSLYKNIKFDAITFVPMPKRKILKRGYNQSRVLALKIAKTLKIPVSDDLLYCKYSEVFQHQLNLTERFDHVKGLYGYNHSNSGEIILLVDDIKTSGATLDECSRQLLLSGCQKVYCVTGLVGTHK